MDPVRDCTDIPLCPCYHVSTPQPHHQDLLSRNRWGWESPSSARREHYFEDTYLISLGLRVGTSFPPYFLVIPPIPTLPREYEYSRGINSSLHGACLTFRCSIADWINPPALCRCSALNSSLLTSPRFQQQDQVRLKNESFGV